MIISCSLERDPGNFRGNASFRIDIYIVEVNSLNVHLFAIVKGNDGCRNALCSLGKNRMSGSPLGGEFRAASLAGLSVAGRTGSPLKLFACPRWETENRGEEDVVRYVPFLPISFIDLVSSVVARLFRKIRNRYQNLCS